MDGLDPWEHQLFQSLPWVQLLKTQLRVKVPIFYTCWQLAQFQYRDRCKICSASYGEHLFEIWHLARLWNANKFTSQDICTPKVWIETWLEHSQMVEFESTLLCGVKRLLVWSEYCIVHSIPIETGVKCRVGVETNELKLESACSCIRSYTICWDAAAPLGHVYELALASNYLLCLG